MHCAWTSSAWHGHGVGPVPDMSTRRPMFWVWTPVSREFYVRTSEMDWSYLTKQVFYQQTHPN